MSNTNPTKTGGELRCSEESVVPAPLATNPVINHEWGKDREMLTTSGTYPWSFVTQIFHNGQPSHGGDRQNFELMTSAYPRGTLDSVASLLAATLYLENPDRNSLFSGVRLVRSLVFCVKLYISLFIFFFFWPLYCLFSPIYDFWLPFWYLQTFSLSCIQVLYNTSYVVYIVRYWLSFSV